MKKSFLFIALLAASITTFAESKVKADTAKTSVKKVTHVEDPVLHVNITKAGAVRFLKAIHDGYTVSRHSKELLADDLSNEEEVDDFFVDLIYKKWPDLIPKPPTK